MMSFDGGVPTSCVETDGKCLQKETQVQLCNACLNRTCFLLLFGAWLGILHSSVVQLNELPVNERQKQSSLRETSSSALSSCFSARTGSADVRCRRRVPLCRAHARVRACVRRRPARRQPSECTCVWASKRSSRSFMPCVSCLVCAYSPSMRWSARGRIHPRARARGHDRPAGDEDKVLAGLIEERARVQPIDRTSGRERERASASCLLVLFQ